MDRNNPIWYGLNIFLIVNILFSVSIAGTIPASAEDPESQVYYISDAGDPENVYSYETSQNITGIKIRQTENKTENRDIILYVSVSDLYENGFDVSDIGIEDSNVTGGRITGSNLIIDEDKQILSIQLTISTDSNEAYIRSIELNGIDSSKGKVYDEMEYELGVVTEESTKSYEALKDENSTNKSDKFQYLSGELIISDQATMSTSFARDRRTSSGVTINQISSNVNSTVVLTDKDDGDIVGYQSLTLQELNDEQRISLTTSNLGGKYGAFLVPSSQVNIEDEDVGTEVSEDIKEVAIAVDNFQTYLGTVNFEDQRRSPENASKLSVSKVELRDTVGMKTPYIVSLHPITSTGKVAYDKHIGNTDVLVGVHKNIPMKLGYEDGKPDKIRRSNRFVATIRLAEEYNLGDSVEINKTRRLLNSDISDQFVDGDVSDSAKIRISNVPKDVNSSEAYDYEFNNSDYDDENVYSGGLVAFKSNTSASEDTQLLRRQSDNRSIVVGIGSVMNSTGHVIFNTTRLDTGQYSPAGSGFDESGNINVIGSGDRTVNLTQSDSKVSYGERTNYTLHHNISGGKVRLVRSYNNETYVTANLTTQTTGNTTVGINSYALGNHSQKSNVVTAGAGVTVDSIDTSLSTDSLPPGSYRLVVRSEQGLASTTDATTFTVDDRATNGMQTYATSTLNPEDLASARAVRQAIGTGDLSPTDTVSESETVVYAVNATGLTGLPAARNATLATGGDVAELDGLDFGVASNTSADSTTVDDDDGATKGSMPPNASVHVDDRGLYLVSNGSDALATDETPADGTTFTAEFRVTDDRLQALASSSATDHNASATVQFEAASSTQSDDEAGDGGDGMSGGGGAGGGSTGGAGGGGAGGGGAGGGGGTGSAGGGQAGGSGQAGESPRERADTASGADARERGRSDGNPLERRYEIRPAADVRSVTHGDPTPVSDTVFAPSRTAPGGDEAARAEGGAATRGSSAGGAAVGAKVVADRESASNEEPAAATQSSDGSTSDDGPGTGEAPASTYDDAPIRATAEDLPGFGPLPTLLALVLTGRLIASSRRS